MVKELVKSFRETCKTLFILTNVPGLLQVKRQLLISLQCLLLSIWTSCDNVGRGERTIMMTKTTMLVTFGWLFCISWVFFIAADEFEYGG